MSGFVLVSFFSIIILLVLIVIAFACLFGLIGGILLITGIIKKKRGRATKLKKVSVVFFIISAVLWIVPAVFTFCMRLYTFSMRQDYVDTGVKVQAEEGAGVFDFEWEGEKLAPLEREYFDIIYINGESKTKAVCNIEYVHEWKWLSDFLLGDPDIDTMYQVENGSGYPIYQYDRWIGCLERDREAVLDYYDNKVPLTFYYIREEEDDWEKKDDLLEEDDWKEKPWPTASFDKGLQKELESCQDGQREQEELLDSEVTERVWITAYSEDYLKQEEWELLIAGKQVYICIDTEHPDGREMRVNHCIPLTKESGTYILKTLEQ